MSGRVQQSHLLQDREPLGRLLDLIRRQEAWGQTDLMEQSRSFVFSHMLEFSTFQI